MLSVTQGSCEYQCQSHWFDPTRNQTRVYSSRDRRSIPLGHLSCQVFIGVQEFMGECEGCGEKCVGMWGKMWRCPHTLLHFFHTLHISLHSPNTSPSHPLHSPNTSLHTPLTPPHTFSHFYRPLTHPSPPPKLI